MPDTMGKRLKIAMMEQDLRQVDVIEQLRSYGIRVSRSQLSKVLNDEITTPNIEFIRAIKKILGLSMDYIIDGEEPGTEAKQDQFMTEEAGQVATIVDRLPPDYRKMVVEAVQLLQRSALREQEQTALITQLLIDNINLMTSHHREIAAAYIARHRQGTRA